MTPVVVAEGDGPVILGMPHVGTDIADAIAARLNARGKALADTDWWIDTLYDGLLPSATTVRATFSRYVIDANRDPSGQSLYPGRNTTELCPTVSFDGEPIYRPGAEPDADEIDERRKRYHAPYHDALGGQIDRVRERHGVAILYDCHSIRSHIPNLFDGALPVFNIGTNDGTTCDARFERAVADVCAAAEGLDHVVNGRFKGGWTTRRHGRPSDGVHAVQMELAQRAYMDEAPPWRYDTARAGHLRAYLKDLLTALERLALDGRL